MHVLNCKCACSVCTTGPKARIYYILFSVRHAIVSAYRLHVPINLALEPDPSTLDALIGWFFKHVEGKPLTNS
eukprot:452572-Amorphochlora_amoeboformis.AAC.1